MGIVKSYLLSYETPKYLALSDSIDYLLTIKKVWFWGLFSTERVITYTIGPFDNARTHFDHWDYLIKYNKPLK